MTERAHLSIREVLDLLVDEFPDVTISKIRFLESRGLIQPERTPSGYRRFYEPDVERLRWILRQQRENFLPLKVIKGRLEAAGGGVAPESSEPSLFDDYGDAAVDPAYLVGPSVRSPGTNGDVSGLYLVPAGHATPAVTSAAAETTSAGSGSEQPFAVEQRVETSRAEQRVQQVAGSAGGGRRVVADGAGAARAKDAVVASRSLQVSGTHALVELAEHESSPERGGPEHGGPGHGGPGHGHPPAERPAAAPDRGAGAAGRPGQSAEPARPGGATGGARRKGRQPKTAPVTPAAPAAEVAASPVPGAGHGESGAPRPATSTASAGVAGGLASGMSLSGDELASAAGVEIAVVAELEEYGLIAGRLIAGVRCFDEEALAVARVAARFRTYGIESRHLRTFKHAAEREAGLFSQVVTPLLRQRNPAARERATASLAELSELGSAIQLALLRAELRALTGG